MRLGYWFPVFGGWLRNVADEGMDTSWAAASRLARRSEELGFDLTLIAELFLNDIKGVEAPTMDAWTTAAAVAAVTERLELMVAVRPTFHNPAIFAKQAACLDQLSGGRLALNVVSSWWADEARRYGVRFDAHDDRYARTAEWLAVLDGGGPLSMSRLADVMGVSFPNATGIISRMEERGVIARYSATVDQRKVGRRIERMLGRLRAGSPAAA